MSTAQDNTQDSKLENLTVVELQKLSGTVQDLIEVKKREEIINLYESLEEKAKEAGFENLEALHAKYIELKAEMKKGKTRSPVEPLYMNKANPKETWTGRGKHPRWLVNIAKERGVEVSAIVEEFRI